MSKAGRLSPRCIIIAGPNGAGKTTFAREFLAKEADVIHFVNPDLIASGLSPLRPELAAFAAGRLFLREPDRLANAGDDFAFESTLSGFSYLSRVIVGKLPAGGSKWYICGSRRRSLHSAVSPGG
jgi:predicted ABC-type ATPase